MTGIFDYLISSMDNKICRNCRGLGMTGIKNPVSITETEFIFIRDYIIKHNLKNGFEVATAFGVSACAAGLGFKKTGGKLITMDCYIEELTKDCSAYSHFRDEQKLENKEPHGLKVAKELFKICELENITTLIGLSPQDIPASKYDYVFVDAEHTLEAVKKDLLGIKPYLEDKFVVFVHDFHCFPGLEDFIYREFGCHVQKEVAQPEHYNLALFERL